MNLNFIPYNRPLFQSTVRPSDSPGSGLLWPIRIFLVLLLSWTGQFASGQSRLIEFADAVQPPLAVPALAQSSRSIRVPLEALGSLKPGSVMAMQIAQDQFVTMQLVQLQSFVNGDITVSAHGQDEHAQYRLTLTVGSENLFGYVTADENLWQIHAVKTGAEYAGWVYRPGTLNQGRGLASDFFLPTSITPLPEAANSANNSAPRLPLQIGSAAQAPAIDETANSESVQPGNFSITQTFSPDPVLPGGTVQASLVLRNSSSEALTAIILEVYFLLEDSILIAAPANCAESLSLSLQTVLRCELGSFASGEEKSLSFTVQADTVAGTQLVSSAVIGNLRVDHAVNVVEDVRTDSDRDGISDFNEALAGTDAADPESVDFSVSTIDVMALYTAGAASLYPGSVETRINQLVAVANQIYRDSGVAITLRPVLHEQVDYNDVDDMDTALDHMMNQSHPAFSDLQSLRSLYGADLVMLFRPLELAGDRCGLAPVGGFRSNGFFNAETERQFAFSHIAIDCPVDIAVAHELGHNMGLTHSHREDGYGGTFNFSTGYGLDGQFATVMAYPEAFGTENRVARFSDPLAVCLGFACGIDADEELGADAVQTLNLVRQQIASYYPTRVPDPPTLSVVALSGSTNATITITASRDAGLSFSNQFTPSDRVDLRASIKVDNRHVGQQGSLHMLVAERHSNELYQLNELGDLVVWDGELGSLIPVGGSRTLGLEEHLRILDGFQFGEEMVGLELAVYIGYQVPGSNDFVYTDSPLALDVIKSP